MSSLADILKARAALAALIRDFFHRRDVLEVTTPVLSQAAVTDPAISSFQVACRPSRFLRTSPEFAMKRLLCAGVPDIFELGPVFRDDEQGSLHHPEFILLEWYRQDFSMMDLIREVLALLVACKVADPSDTPRIATYRELFLETLGIDIERTDDAALRALAATLGLQDSGSVDRDGLLDLLFATRLQEALQQHEVAVVTHFPASQAALATLDPANPAYALRFEVFVRGVELANGFEELRDAAEQQRRFDADNRLRAARRQSLMPVDERFLQALQRGLPACSGVALGFERLLMLSANIDNIEDVVPLPWSVS